MNRAERVYDYMREFGSITQLDCIKDLGYTRLACAISEIKQGGHNVKTVMETGKNRWGKPTHYARYSLVERNENQTN